MVMRRFFASTIRQDEPGVGFLDSFPGAFRAFANRKVYSGYEGFAMQITLTGSTFEDIGFNEDGTLDTDAISAFGGSSDVSVHKWYDQSGNGRDWIIDGTNRPKISISGNIQTRNGSPVLRVAGSEAFTWVPDNYSSNLNIFYSFDSAVTMTHVWHGMDVSGKFGFVSADGSASTTIHADYGTPVLYKNKIDQEVVNRDDVFHGTRPDCIVAEIGADVSNWTPNKRRLGLTGQLSSGQLFTGDWIEFEGAISQGNIDGISDAINEAYSFY